MSKRKLESIFKDSPFWLEGGVVSGRSFAHLPRYCRSRFCFATEGGEGVTAGLKKKAV